MPTPTNTPTKNDTPNSFNNEEHLVKFTYLDGFCDRLLNIELLLDLDFNFELTYSTFQLDQKRKQGKLPNEIRTDLLALIELDLSQLNESYEIHEGATDFPFYTMMMNQYGENRTYTIGTIPISSEGHSNEEQLFFKILFALKKFLTRETGYEIN